jgi:uncharacterized protein YbaR (Trm112 family)
MYTSALQHKYPKGEHRGFKAQFEAGILVCPVSKQRLVMHKNNQSLSSESGEYVYPINNEVPLLLKDQKLALDYIAHSSKMLDEYKEFKGATFLELKYKVLSLLNTTWQSKKSIQAHAVTHDIPVSGFCISIGGGPSRSHPKAANLNIGPFENVDIVADAHDLPYLDNSIDSIVCEDVLEHIKDPKKVVQEIFRVIKPGGHVYAATPFLISYHGYPSHFQNLTHQGHEELFLDSGFQIVDSGVCMGAWTALLSLIGFIFANFLPKTFGLNRFVCNLWSLVSAALKPIDRLFQGSPQVALSTFVLAKK